VFYETLAEKSDDRNVADLCRSLAVQEKKHYGAFKEMSDALVQRPVSRPLSWDELQFAQILIEERVLSDPDAARDAAGSGTLQDCWKQRYGSKRTVFFSTTNC